MVRSVCLCALAMTSSSDNEYVWRRVLVRDRPMDVDAKAVRAHFAPLGPLAHLHHSRPRRHAFVTYEEEEAALRAIHTMDGTDFNGSVIKVNEGESVVSENGCKQVVYSLLHIHGFLSSFERVSVFPRFAWPPSSILFRLFL